ncbi:MAG: PAS domain-containing protein [Alphaproteobacteria bacterium]|nr:PAS domain-containing protein [Alphaproteobacteria bacterium]
MLSKFVAMFSAAPVLMFIVFAMTGVLSVDYAVYGSVAILGSSLVFARPYLQNVAALTRYVDDLAQDRTTEQPDLSFLSTEGGLSESVKGLQESWEKKKQQLESMLSEREILVDTLPDILFMLDIEGNILRTNSAARAQFGQNLAHRPFAQVVDNPELIDAMQKTLADFNGRGLEFKLDGEGNHTFRARIERFPVHSPGGINVIVSLHDITELKAIEQMRADFIANASHEIKTPLASLVGFIETLRGPAKGDVEATERFLGIMAGQAERMTRLVSDLLSLSKLEMNADKIPDGKVNLVSVIQKEISHVEWKAKDKKVAFAIRLQPHLPEVTGAENELSQVLQNLIENAVKYCNPSSTISVTADVTTDIPPGNNLPTQVAVRVMVEDESEGIAREHLPRLTERFYRVDTARSRKAGGTGLGLSIVKHVLHRHRGFLHVESEVGKGSVFSIYLPFEAA